MSRIELIDTHCHLVGHSDEEVGLMLERARASGVTRAVCIGAGTGDNSAREAVRLAELFPDLWATIGVHPHDAKSHTDLEHLRDLFHHPKVVAIGETGLDFFRDWSPVDRQYELFRNSIRTAKSIGKKLVIHCRTAEEETVRVLEEEGASEVGGVFHCYGVDATFAERIRKLNFIVSFTGTVTFKSAHALRDTVKAIELDHFMLETDAPYMAPEPFRGGPSEPMHVLRIAEKIAEVKGVSLAEVARVTTATALRFFGIPAND